MRRNLSIIALLALAFFGAQAAKAGTVDLVTNGSFETGDFTGWGGSYVTLAGTAPNQAGVDGTDVYAGNYEAYLGAFGSKPTYTLSQALTTVVGNLYTISFYLDNQANDSTGYENSFSASFGGVSLFSETDALGSPYKLYTFTSLATTNSTLLSFTARNDASFFDLDSVSVVGPAAASVTPEPSSLILLGTGLVGMVGVIRRRIVA